MGDSLDSTWHWDIELCGVLNEWMNRSRLLSMPPQIGEETALRGPAACFGLALYGQSPYWHSGSQRVWLMHIIRFKGWNSHAYRGFPGSFESTNLSRNTLSREIGRTVRASACVFWPGLCRVDFAWERGAPQSSSGNCSPAPDSALWKPIFTGALFFRSYSLHGRRDLMICPTWIRPIPKARIPKETTVDTNIWENRNAHRHILKSGAQRSSRASQNPGLSA